MRQIERLDVPTPRTFDREFRRKSRPAIFRFDDPTTLARWTPQSLRDNHGDLIVPIQTKDELTGDRFAPIQLEYEPRRLGDYVDEITGPGAAKGYFAQFQIFDQLPELYGTSEFPKFFNRFHRTNFFLGPRGTRAMLHYDQDENLFWQLYGGKRVVLASPAQAPLFYPTNEWWGDGYSPVDVDAPDLEKFPRFREAEFYEAILEPGDMLYIPLRWWHDVTSLGVSVSLARIWWPIPLLLSSLWRRERSRLSSLMAGKPTRTTYGPEPGKAHGTKGPMFGPKSLL